jgi:hypothetical protein
MGYETGTNQSALNAGHDIVSGTVLAALFLGTLAVPVGLLLRTVARARVRAGSPDPLDRARRWTESHPRATRALVAAPALVSLTGAALPIAHSIKYFAVYTYGEGPWGEWTAAFRSINEATLYHAQHLHEAGMSVVGVVAVFAAAGVYAATRAGVRELLAPTLDPAEPATDPAAAADRIHFDAVAVTAETRAAVAVMAVLPVVALLGIGAARLGDAGTQAALAGYVALALGGALAFRRASRVAIGVDGVYVTGSSRTRFFAYKDLDGARVKDHAIELFLRGKVALRLQLHGEDAALEASVLARIEEAIAKAQSGESAGPGRLVASASEGDLARIGEGATDYRAPALTREQLWALVEGSEHDARTRTRAATALARTRDSGERARLRVAAEHCAEPSVRVVLRDLAGESEDDGDEARCPAPRRE